MIRSVNSDEGRGYSAEAELAYVEQQIATILYIVGLDGLNQDAYEIEDVIDAIHSSFYFYPVNESKGPLAHEFFMKKHSNMLKIVYRKARTAKKLIEGALSDV
jgi:hypothetical protein